MVGYARTLYGKLSKGLPVIGFDMGGTSTDGKKTNLNSNSVLQRLFTQLFFDDDAIS